MLHLIYSVLGFIIAIAILVTIHEFGHFWVARRCGVKVLRFSVGFGKPIWKHTSKVDGTEYVLALIPLGGYVSMLGEADNTKDQINEDNRDQAYNEKSVYRRMAITLAGPAANFIFAIAAFWLLYIVGIPGIQPKVAAVLPDSYASKAGFKAGDSITEIDGEKAQTWNMVRFRILTALVRQESIQLKSESSNNTQKKHVLDFRKTKYFLGPGSRSPLYFTGFRVALPPTIAFVAPGMAAEKAGLQMGDTVVRLNDQPITTFHDMWPILYKNAGSVVDVKIRRNGKMITLKITPIKQDKVIGLIGVRPKKNSTVISEVVSGDPAHEAGMLVGDKIVKINGLEINVFRDIQRIVNKNAGVRLLVEVNRHGKTLGLNMTPKKYTQKTYIGGLIGVSAAQDTTKESYSILTALGVGAWKTWDMSTLTFQVFGKMITREASVKNVSGPFRIADVAGRAAERGLDWYIYILAVISLSLGVINLLPIPVLDGGHFMFQVAELVTGRPVSDSVKAVGMAIGLGLILMLMGLAFYNDFVWLLAKFGM
ncbi:Intramembrane protease RasP/YluC, implicated in cell division based on FtsL cleavage [hydrothermal vent metagenome]|uniref:Intramembrane protease RasP/YluC, implicated in cell division based on FtsL cleavage n=1 Tax=hydrothermal vent metagenome TaxID=652676 RepID=A0A3B0YDY8_9ZZZZ